VGGILAATPQYQQVSGAPSTGDELKAGVAFQPELSFRPRVSDELFLKLGFAAGNGLNKVSLAN
jgi:hypothetical protein